MYESISAIIEDEKKTSLPFWKLIQRDDCIERDVSEEESFESMKKMYLTMKDCVKNYDPTLHSNSSLVGGEAVLLRKYIESGKLLSGDFIGQVMEKALMVAESNACMRRIVAAPTAGSCGVVPAVFISLQEKLQISDEEMTKALYVAAGVGGVIAIKASLSGAEGGCQAEIGSASSMAAAGMCYLLGGNSDQIANAAALALKNLLGLACDPVAGLVEIPCVKRNVCGAVNAVTSAELTMAGISSKIPADEVFEAMHNISRTMSDTIKETATGGLATTPTGKEIAARLSRS
ncbi:MAG: L-serine ammonia-lyase, iron-sulfur-dependent, subunit alpha [Butyrivibrio sp.]|uniref:L-serine ammonia-lyase, iron-sulfur-dependent, subunit alpha n=1 Tax=Butyrivibrio sp. NC2002 TaxID=1410610 RepID=UPI0005623E70|nr:L-serine ammonia-lyase, iron-sulfur-dependent, subunit alpha [Butyrivibrio sp. NC2002]MBE5861081.1 L-serine ammonia-lyase, iron-sulfur-dependent, subunit alpha [Butyrivibrio sp.]